jgi:hypothetical protein
MKVPAHLGLVFHSEPDWTIADWTILLDFLKQLKIKYLTCYTRNGWSCSQLSSNNPIVSFIDYSQSKPLLATIARDFCKDNAEISLEFRSNPVNLLLLESDLIDGFPPLMLAFAEILRLNSLDDSVSGFIDGIKEGVEKYSQTSQRYGI